MPKVFFVSRFLNKFLLQLAFAFIFTLKQEIPIETVFSDETESDASGDAHQKALNHKNQDSHKIETRGNKNKRERPLSSIVVPNKATKIVKNGKFRVKIYIFNYELLICIIIQMLRYEYLMKKMNRLLCQRQTRKSWVIQI